MAKRSSRLRKDGTEKPSFWKRPLFQLYKAFILAFLASTLMGISDIPIKSIEYLSVSQLAFVRYLGLFTFNLPVIHQRRDVLYEKTTFPFLMGRSIFGFVSVYLSYLGIKLMPIAESTVIVSTVPVWVTLLARIFLKERLDKWNTLSIVVCLIGMLLMSRVFTLASDTPDEKYSSATYWYGCAASFGCTICLAFIYVFLRRLKGIHPSVTIFYQSLTGMTFMAVLELIIWKLALPECGEDGAKVVMFVVLAYLGQLTLTAAFRYEKAGPVAVVHEASYVAVSFFVQIFYFKDIPDVYSILAAVLVIASLVLSAVRKALQNRQKTDDNQDTRVETEV